MPKHRTQLFLEQDQYESLSELASRQQCSISEVVRALIDSGLERRREERVARLAALEELSELREKVARRLEARGERLSDPVAEVRAEREAQQEAVLRGDSTR